MSSHNALHPSLPVTRPAARDRGIHAGQRHVQVDQTQVSMFTIILSHVIFIIATFNP